MKKNGESSRFVLFPQRRFPAKMGVVASFLEIHKARAVDRLAMPARRKKKIFFFADLEISCPHSERKERRKGDEGGLIHC